MSDPRQEGAAAAAPSSPDPQQAAAAYAAAAGRAAGASAQPAAGRAGAHDVVLDDAVSVKAPVDGEAAGTPGRLGDEQADGEDSHEHERQVVRDLDELTARAEKADEYLVLAQRTRADFDNYRKRAEKKVSEAQERGVAKLARELLPAIDNLDRAVQASEAFAGAGPEESAAAAESQLASGIRLVHADVLAALARVGIEVYSPAGEPFDPQLHEAVAHQPVEGAPAGTVMEVYQQGYRLGEMVLRPARVLVAA